MLTFRAGKLTVLVVLLSLAAACSREQQDWRSAEAADTVEGYGQFLERHPESELATQAHARVAQLSEDREWQRAGSADTVDAYRQFLAQHPSGKWAQEARIRIENFSLGGSPVSETSVLGARAATAAESSATASVGPLRAPAGQLAAGPSAGAEATSARAFPGEAAVAPAASQPAFSTATALAQSASPVPTHRSNVPSSEASNASAARVASSTSSTTRASPSSSEAPAGPRAVPAGYNSGQGGSPSGYSVQLGAFGSESAATNQWQQLTGRFGTELRGLAPHVVSANTATGRLFRLQAQVADESRARAICDSLKKQSQACVPVLPH